MMTTVWYHFGYYKYVSTCGQDRGDIRGGKKYNNNNDMINVVTLCLTHTRTCHSMHAVLEMRMIEYGYEDGFGWVVFHIIIIYYDNMSFCLFTIYDDV